MRRLEELIRARRHTSARPARPTSTPARFRASTTATTPCGSRRTSRSGWCARTCRRCRSFRRRAAASGRRDRRGRGRPPGRRARAARASPPPRTRSSRGRCETATRRGLRAPLGALARAARGRRGLRPPPTWRCSSSCSSWSTGSSPPTRPRCGAGCCIEPTGEPACATRSASTVRGLEVRPGGPGPSRPARPRPRSGARRRPSLPATPSRATRSASRRAPCAPTWRPGQPARRGPAPAARRHHGQRGAA